MYVFLVKSNDLLNYQPTTQYYIPILDDPITPYKMDIMYKKTVE
jgi:hypothetical protein